MDQLSVVPDSIPSLKINADGLAAGESEAALLVTATSFNGGGEPGLNMVSAETTSRAGETGLVLLLPKPRLMRLSKRSYF